MSYKLTIMKINTTVCFIYLNIGNKDGCVINVLGP